jgi:hypothetical protein
MQVNQKLYSLYKEKAPELLDILEEKDGLSIIKRDSKTDHCVKFEKGICGIQAKHGSDYLGDACHFFPRITRKIGSKTVMSAALSCPEITRLVLTSPNPFEFNEVNIERLPESLQDHLTNDLNEEDTLLIINQLINIINDKKVKPETALIKIATLARSLDNLPKESWFKALGALSPIAEQLAQAKKLNENDPYFLIQSFVLLAKASNNKLSPKLKEIFHDIAEALKIDINWETAEVVINQTGSFEKYSSLYKQLNNEELEEILRRYLITSFIISFLPFSTTVEKVQDQVLIAAAKYSLIKLAIVTLVDLTNFKLNESKIITLIHSLSRFLDHLSNPNFLLTVFKDYGWGEEGRLRSLLEA